MTEIATVRQNSYGNWSEGQDRRARINRRAELVVADFWLQMVLDGRMFAVNIGSEDDAVNSTTSIDDQLVWAVTDITIGNTIIPAFAQVQAATWTTSTLLNFMLEADMGKVRYSSGGTAFTPVNLRGDTPRLSAGTTYCNTSTNAGVTVAAKSTLGGSEGSIELYRISIEDNWGDTGDTIPEMVYSPRIPAVIVGPGSLLFHYGAGTADTTGYGIYYFVELPSESVT